VLPGPRLQTCKKLSFHAEFYSVKCRHSSVPTQPRNVQQPDIGETPLKIDEFAGIYRGGIYHGADVPKAVAGMAFIFKSKFSKRLK
jgi:hypothetical protein